MSNPIADTAEYFARWQRNSSQIQHDSPEESPQLDHDANDASLTDIRAQWQRVLNRLSFLNPPEQEYSDDDDDTFELIRDNKRLSSRHYSLNVSTSATGAVRGRDIDNQDDPTAVVIEDEGEEKLPSTYELEQGDEAIVEGSNYFTHPFNTTEDFDEIQVPKPASTRSRRNDFEGVQQQESAIRDKWDRTLDKLKLIANLQSTSNTTTSLSMPGPSHTLATYYPPAFDPLFSAFTKDEYGRKLVTNNKQTTNNY